MFRKRSAKMIDKTEKPKIPSKFAKRAAQYNEFGYNKYYYIILLLHPGLGNIKCTLSYF